MILHIPHSSINTLGKSFMCDVTREIERMTDIKTDSLFAHPFATVVKFPISRLICDVERFEDDAMELMAEKGMGVCYITNSFGQPLREVTDIERNEIITTYYKPHHELLYETVQAELSSSDKSLIIDCHSFQNIPLPHEGSQKQPRPDICIGTDDFHTPKDLAKSAIEYFISCGYSVCENDPFSGTMIPMRHYKSNQSVHGLMIEVNRDLYKSNFEDVKSNITSWLDLISKNY